jgi:hypothetical protein
MEKKGHLYEIIIKSIYLIVGIIGLIIILNGIVNIVPLFASFSLDYNQMQSAIMNTEFAHAYKTLTSVDYFNSSLILKIFLSFIANLSIFPYLFLVLTLLLSILFFIFIKWPLVSSYFKISLMQICVFIGKYLLFGLSLLIFYNNDIKSLATGLFIGTIIYLLTSILQIFLHSLWILKFVLNITEDIKAYNNC